MRVSSPRLLSLVFPHILCIPLRTPSQEEAPALVAINQKIAQGELIAKSPKGHTIHSPYSGVVQDLIQITLEDEQVSGAIVLKVKGELSLDPTPKPLKLKQNPSSLLSTLHQKGVLGPQGRDILAEFTEAQTSLEQMKYIVFQCYEDKPFVDLLPLFLKQNSLLEDTLEFLHQMMPKATLIVYACITQYRSISVLRKRLQKRKVPFKVKFLIPHYAARLDPFIFQKIFSKELPLNTSLLENSVFCLETTALFDIHQALWYEQAVTQRWIRILMPQDQESFVVKTPVGYPLVPLLQNASLLLNQYHYAFNRSLLPQTHRHSHYAIHKNSSVVRPLLKTKILNKDEQSPCVRCNLCSINCPVGLKPLYLNYLIDHNASDQTLIDEGLLKCIECQICSVVCPSSIPLSQKFKASKQAIQKRLL